MPQQRDPILWRVRSVVPAVGFLELVTEPWTGRDQVMYLDEISVCNATSSGGDVEVGLLMGGRHFELDTVFALVAGMYHYAHGQVTILSKWQVYARFLLEDQVCQPGDICDLHVVGYVLEPYTSP